MPFEVGEEVLFRPNGQVVEGIVLDVGWYRTLIRSFEREMYVIPNAVFSKNTVLNVTRKNKEWRFYEFLCVRVQDVHKVNAIIQVCLCVYVYGCMSLFCVWWWCVCVCVVVVVYDTTSFEAVM